MNPSNIPFRSFRKPLALFLASLLLFSGIPFSASRVWAEVGSPANINAQDIDDMMAKLRDPQLPPLEKQRLTAVIFVHQDIYRRAVINGNFPAKSPNVDAFIENKTLLQKDAASAGGGSQCPPGSINLLGVCSATGT